MKEIHRFVLAALALQMACVTILTAEPNNPFIGRWALTLEDDFIGWLGVTQEAGYLDARLLWKWGSVHTVASIYMIGDTLYITRLQEVNRKDEQDEVVRTHTLTETFVATVSGDELQLRFSSPNMNGQGLTRTQATGKRIAPLPPKPDLSKVKYGRSVKLLGRNSLKGWKLTDPKQVNGWRVEDGVLINHPEQHEGEDHIDYGNLRTVKEYEDFNLTLEVNIGKDQNSGVYLRGIYEVQVLDSYDKPLDRHNLGSIYSRMAPSVSAEKPAGQWQTMDITLLDRHVTVQLNGTTIIDNEPLLGCTGGALWSDEFRPGPIFLQGDHTGIKYRKIVLRPIKK